MKKNNWKIVLAGEGGQGLIMAGRILAETAALHEGKTATQSQSYGSQQRGGFSSAEVVIADNEIYYPKADLPDVVLALTQVAYEKYHNNVPDQCVILYDIDEVESKRGKGDKGYPLKRLSLEMKDQRVINTIGLGVLVKATGVVSTKNVVEVMKKYFKDDAFSLNEQSFFNAYNLD